MEGEVDEEVNAEVGEIEGALKVDHVGALREQVGDESELLLAYHGRDTSLNLILFA